MLLTSFVALLALAQAGPACPSGMVSNEDTKGHCCWPEQAWSNSKGHCLGRPACPAGTAVAASGEACVFACPSGKAITEETAGQCCWPGQVWSKSRSTCVGKPSCPPSMSVAGEDCVAGGAMAPPPTPPTPPPELSATPPPPPPPPAAKIDANERYGTVDASASENGAAESQSSEPVLSPFHPAHRDTVQPSLGLGLQAISGLVFIGVRGGLDVSRFFGLHLSYGNALGVHALALGLEFGSPYFQLPSVMRRVALAGRLSTDGWVWLAGRQAIGGPRISPGVAISVAIIHNLAFDFRTDVNIQIGIAGGVAVVPGVSFLFGLRWSP